MLRFAFSQLPICLPRFCSADARDEYQEPIFDEIVLSFTVQCKVHMGDDPRVLKGDLLHYIDVDFDAVTLQQKRINYLLEGDDDEEPDVDKGDDDDF